MSRAKSGAPARRARAPLAARRGQALEFMRAMWALDHALHRASKRMAATLGVTAPQRLVVRVLGEESADTPGALARMLHLHPSTLTGVLQRLERRGLIERSVENADRRRSRLTLTRRGEQINTRNTGTVESAIEATLQRVSAADADAAVRVLLAVAATLRQTSERRSRGGRRSAR
jgi:MarR family transcriptional regulator, organic hydroperoxide resistance regulator